MVKTEGGPGSITSFFASLSYGLMGRIAIKLKPLFIVYYSVYLKSGLELYFPAYISVMLFSSFLTFITTMIISFYLHYFVLSYTLLTSGILSFILSIATSGLVLGLFYAYPIYAGHSVARKIERGLPETLNFMASIASAGLTAEEILERAAEFESDPSIKKILTLIVREIQLMGKDVVTAIKEAIDRCPSLTMSALLEGLLNVILTSGDLASFLHAETMRFLQLKRERLKKVVGSIALAAEGYIALVVVFPTILIIMLSIMGVIGGSIFGVPPAVLTPLFIFILTPMLAIGILIMIDSILSGV